jgi:hypothetical protein
MKGFPPLTFHNHIKQAISAGQSIEHFAIERAALAMTEPRPKVDWSQDPFAGSRHTATCKQPCPQLSWSPM